MDVEFLQDFNRLGGISKSKSVVILLKFVFGCAVVGEIYVFGGIWSTLGMIWWSLTFMAECSWFLGYGLYLFFKVACLSSAILFFKYFIWLSAVEEFVVLLFLVVVGLLLYGYTQQHRHQMTRTFIIAPNAPSPPLNSAAPKAECVICLSNQASMLLYPCGHLCLCEECAKRFKSEPSGHQHHHLMRQRLTEHACPICRGSIIGVCAVYG